MDRWRAVLYCYGYEGAQASRAAIRGLRLTHSQACTELRPKSSNHVKPAALPATVVCSLCVSFGGCHSTIAATGGPAMSATTAPAPSAETAPVPSAPVEALWACGRWSGGPVPDRNQVVLMDILFNPPRPDEPVKSLLTPSPIDRLVAVGGVVVHRYSFGAVRAKLPIAGFDRITGSVNHARIVRDTTRYAWGAIVGYRNAPTPDDERVVRELGGRFVHRLDAVGMLTVEDLPDTAFVALRGRQEVSHVQPSSMLCLRGASALATSAAR